MVFDIQKLLPRERIELPEEKIKKYSRHYSALMAEYGYHRRSPNEKAFDTIADYMAVWYGSSGGECSPPERGLFLFGEKGTGKTTAMQLFSGFFSIQYVTMAQLTREFAIGSHRSFWSAVDEYKGVPLIVDDLGCEEKTSSFGNEVPIADFIRDREIQWREWKVNTFFTSNAKSREDLTKRYGASVCSRILGMCDFVHFAGSDKRIERKKGE